MYKTPKKAHACCPNCDCGISFDYSILNSDFHQLEGTEYKYYGALNPSDNIRCLYCNTQLQRGNNVIIFIVHKGPVTREFRK